MKKIFLLTIFTLIFLPRIQVQAASASFYTSGGGTVYPNTQVNVTVSANSSDTYNAVSVDVSYSNLTYIGASVASGWTGVSGPSNSGGKVSFSGALLGSTASGSKAVLNLTFKVKSSTGTGTINSSGSIALADGNGTIVNGGGNTVTYTVVNAPPPPPAPKLAPNVVTVTSTTHPSQDAWYNLTSAELAWNKEEGVVGFSYSLDDKFDTVLDDTSEGDAITKTFTDLKDGAKYFHIKAQNDVGWGAVATYKVNIDTKAPDPFAVAKLNNSDETKYIIYFATNDSPSGIAYYNLNVDGIDLGKQKSGYEIEKTVEKVTVTAFDNANNKTPEELVINDLESIDADVPQTNAFVFDWKSALITLVTIILLALIGFSVYKIAKRKVK